MLQFSLVVFKIIHQLIAICIYTNVLYRCIICIYIYDSRPSLYLIKSFSIYTCGFVWLSVFEILVDKSLIYKQMRPLPFLLRAKFVCKLNYHLAGWLTVCLSVWGCVCVSRSVCVLECAFVVLGVVWFIIKQRQHRIVVVDLRGVLQLNINNWSAC